MMIVLWVVIGIIMVFALLCLAVYIKHICSEDIVDDCKRGDFTAVRIKVNWDEDGDELYNIECKSCGVWRKVDWYRNLPAAENLVKELLRKHDALKRAHLIAARNRKLAQQKEKEILKRKKNLIHLYEKADDHLSEETRKIIAEDQIEKILR